MPRRYTSRNLFMSLNAPVKPVNLSLPTFFFFFSLNCHILEEEGGGKKSIRAISLCFCTPHSQAWCIACSARGSLLPSQAEIKAGAEQVGKLGLRVEPFRYHMPPFFMPPLTKGYGSKHALPLLPLSRVQTHTHTHTQTLRCTTLTAAPSPTLFCMPFEIVFPPPSPTAVWQFSISTLFRLFNIDFVLFSCRHRSPSFCNRMAFPLLRFIFYRQQWQWDSQRTIIEILVWLGSQDTLPVDVNLIARS